MRSTLHILVAVALLGCGGADDADTVSVSLEEEGSAVDVLGIVVTPDEVIVPVGSEVQLEALGLNSARQTIDLTDAVEWTSDSSSVAAISNAFSEEGLLEGLQPGTTIIYADFEGVQSAHSRVTVTEAELVRLSITPPSVTLGLDDTVQLSAEASFADGSSSSASGQVRWITGDGSVAVLDGDGLLTGKGVGTTTVSIEWQGVQSDAIVVQVVEEVVSTDVDLVINAIYGGIEDGRLDVIVDVKNEGTDPAGGFWIDLFMDPEGTPTFGDFPDAYHMVDYIGAGESNTITFTASTSRQRHDFTIIIDSLNSVAETDETNNVASGDTDGTAGSGGGSGGSADLPNLKFAYVGGYSSEFETEYWVDVTNDGSAPADRFYLDLFFDRTSSDEPEIYDNGDHWKFFDGLGAGETIYTSIVVPDGCAACGAWLMLDGFDLNEESNESDNTEYVVLESAWIRPAAQ